MPPSPCDWLYDENHTRCTLSYPPLSAVLSKSQHIRYETPPPLLPLVSIAIANILPISFMPSLNMHDASRHALQPQNYIMLSLRVQLPKGTLVPSPTATSIVSAHSARGGTHQTLISGTQSADMHSQVNHVSIVCASPRREMDEWANKSTSAASGCLQCYA